MAENSRIEWTTHTFNPWMGCQKVSPGCDHCYAEALMDTRYGKVQWGPHGVRVRTAPANWRKPLQWAKAARVDGIRPRVFCASLADVFDNKAPDGARADLFALIRQTPELDWLLLTKRPENIAKMLPPDWGEGYPNVWLGTTVEDQKRADHRVPILLRTPARVRPRLSPPLRRRGPSRRHHRQARPATAPADPFPARGSEVVASGPCWRGLRVGFDLPAHRSPAAIRNASSSNAAAVTAAPAPGPWISSGWRR